MPTRSAQALSEVLGCWLGWGAGGAAQAQAQGQGQALGQPAAPAWTQTQWTDDDDAVLVERDQSSSSRDKASAVGDKAGGPYVSEHHGLLAGGRGESVGRGGKLAERRHDGKAGVGAGAAQPFIQVWSSHEWQPCTVVLT